MKFQQTTTDYYYPGMVLNYHTKCSGTQTITDSFVGSFKPRSIPSNTYWHCLNLIMLTQLIKNHTLSFDKICKFF